MKEILIKSVMTRDVSCTTPDAKLMDVLAIMLDRHYSCMVVVEGDEPVGIITERGIVKLLTSIQQNPSCLSEKVSKVMSAPPVTINEGDTLFDALVIAKAEKVRHLPVVNSRGRLAGLVTQSDLVSAHFHVYEQQREIIEKSINERTEELRKANDKLKAMSLEDPLLGIGNRRSMEVDLQHTHAAAFRYRFPFSVLLIDVDFFKQYNDYYGHQEGDEALKTVAGHIKKCIREADRIYRYGGEELLIVMPETGIEGAEASARNIVESLKALGIPHVKSPFKTLTISAGISCFRYTRGRRKALKEVVATADRRLYIAKRSGRNQVVAKG